MHTSHPRKFSECAASFLIRPDRFEVRRSSVLLQLNASIRLCQNLNKILHTVVYTKDLWHITRDLTVKYTDQPKIGLFLVLVRLLVFTGMKRPTEVNF